MGLWRTLGRVGAAAANLIPGVGPLISTGANTALDMTEPKPAGGGGAGGGLNPLLIQMLMNKSAGAPMAVKQHAPVDDEEYKAKRKRAASDDLSSRENIPSFKTGGVVQKTGLAKVHKGEVVVPKHGLTPTKALKILQDGSVKGHDITDKQRKFFGAVYSSGVPSSRKKRAASALSNRD